MYKFFVPTPATLDDLKAQYRKLAMLHHPDRGGDTATMQAINNEHDELFRILQNGWNQTHDTYHQNTETPEEFRDIINALLRMGGITVELCGRWLWISGNTLAHKDELKAHGCRWSQTKKMWSWHHAEDGAKWHKTNYTMNRIRTKYGSQIFDAAGETSGFSKIGATA